MRDEIVIFLLVVLLVVSTTAGYSIGTNNAKTTTVTNTVTNGPSSLKVHVTANLAGTGANQTIVANVWEENTLPAKNNVTAADAWSPLLGNLSASGPYLPYSCDSSWPIGVGLMEGHQAISNISLGKYISPSKATYCMAYTNWYTYFVFSPNNSTAIGGHYLYYGNTLLNYSSTDLNVTWKVPWQVTVYGLSPGVYTVVGADEWGHIALAYVTIPPSSSG